LGVVVNLERRPVCGAKVEIWQANSEGHYADPCDAGIATGAGSLIGTAASELTSQGVSRSRPSRPALTLRLIGKSVPLDQG
jgi:protocatechuate 3,4-dioxygenase beta subunit